MKTIGTRIKEARLAAGLTQAKLALKAGCSQTMIGNLEAGSRDGTTKIAALAEALGVRAMWLESGKLPMHYPQRRADRSPDVDQLVEAYQSLSQSAKFEVLSFVAFKRAQVFSEQMDTSQTQPAATKSGI